MKKYLFPLLVLVFFFFGVKTVHAGVVTYPVETNILLTTPNITLVVQAGSSVDSVTVSDSTITVTVSAPDYFSIRSDNKYCLSNNGGFSVNYGSSTSILTVQPNSGQQTVTITPSTQTCTSAVTSSSSNNNSNSQPSAPSCGDQVPTGKTPWLYSATAKNGNQIELKFTNWQSPVDHFILEYGIKSGKYTFGVTGFGNKNTNSYTVNFLWPNTTYYFRVMAGNGCATSTWSNELSTKTLGFISTNNLNITNTAVEQVPAQTGTAGTQNNLPGQVEVSTGKYTVNIIVKDTAGNVIQNATVTLSSPFSVTQTGTTNKDGVATFNDVEAGDYTVDITYNNMQASESINLAGEAKEFNINVTIKPKNVFLSPLVLGAAGIIVLIIVFMAFKLIKKNKIKKI